MACCLYPNTDELATRIVIAHRNDLVHRVAHVHGASTESLPRHFRLTDRLLQVVVEQERCWLVEWGSCCWCAVVRWVDRHHLFLSHREGWDCGWRPWLSRCFVRSWFFVPSMLLWPLSQTPASIEPCWRLFCGVLSSGCNHHQQKLCAKEIWIWTWFWRFPCLS